MSIVLELRYIGFRYGDERLKELSVQVGRLELAMDEIVEDAWEHAQIPMPLRLIHGGRP